MPSFNELIQKKNKYDDLITNLNKNNIHVINLNKEINNYQVDIKTIYAANNELNHFNEIGYKIISQILLEKIF